MTETAANRRLRRRTTSEVVAASIRQEIFLGSLPLGTRLRQHDLAERYGVSTTPVREAFQLLQAEGLVQLDPHRGALVYQPTPEDVREMYEIRMTLESLAVAKAVPNLAGAGQAVDLLDSVLDQLRGASTREQYVELNRRFHLGIYEWSGRPKLCSMIASLRDACNLYLAVVYRQHGEERADTEHRRILDACRAGDVGGAQAAVVEHLQHTVDLVLEGLQSESAPSAPSA